MRKIFNNSGIIILLLSFGISLFAECRQTDTPAPGQEKRSAPENYQRFCSGCHGAKLENSR